VDQVPDPEYLRAVSEARPLGLGRWPVNGSGSFDVQRGGGLCKLRGGRCSFVMAHSGVSPGARGQPPYHPAMMVALLSYAFTQGPYASGRIARACEERLDFMAVTGMQRPDFRTTSDFTAAPSSPPTPASTRR
jgi:hypothetical protein